AVARGGRALPDRGGRARGRLQQARGGDGGRGARERGAAGRVAGVARVARPHREAGRLSAMRPLLIFAVAGVLAVVVQTTLVARVSFLPAAPDLIVTLCVYLGLHY